MRAIVTGAARGLGAAIAERFVRDGADVVLVDVSVGVEAMAERLAATGRVGPGPGRVTLGLVADVSDETACDVAVDRAVRAVGGVDALVNSAGIGGPGADVASTSLAEFRRVLDVNLIGTFLMCRAVAKVMIGQGSGGAIVNIGSVFGQQGVAGDAGYGASKAGIALLTHSLALELAPHDIRANTIAPGNMATEMHWDYLRSQAALTGTTFDEQVEMVRRPYPLGLARHRRRHRGRGRLAGLRRRQLCHRPDDRGERWGLAQLARHRRSGRCPAGWRAAGESSPGERRGSGWRARGGSWPRARRWYCST